MPTQPCPVTLGVIIPCWNDAARLEETLRRFSTMTGIDQTIVGDASADSASADVAARFNAKVVKVAKPNRGRQMNAAAAACTSDVLLFQHVDTEFAQGNVDSILAAMADPLLAGGAFYRKFDPTHRSRQWMEPWVRRINRFGTMYGDQSIFVRRSVFEKIGGYKDIPLMEDVDFSARLRRAGKTILLDPPLLSSARRHRVQGRFRVTLENLAMIALFKFGVSPHRLHKWYYRNAPKIMAQ